MSRPVDWSPLDRGGDPVPGEPDVVEDGGAHYTRVAQAIAVAADRLRQIAGGLDMTSRAVDELREKSREVAGQVERAHERYAGVGAALTAYSGPHRTAQSDSSRALHDAVDARERLAAAQAQVSSAQGSLDRARQQASSAPPDAAPRDLSGLEGAVHTAQNRVQEAEDDLAAAKRLCDQAVEDRDAAADRAVRAIRDVEDSGDLEDGWWDDWGSKVAGVVAKVAGAIATVAGVAALAVAWIPVIGQAAAAVLGTIALVAAAVSFIANLSLALTDKGSWTNVVLDGISLATFGLGRAVIGGARAAYGGAQATARLSAGRFAALSPTTRAAQGMPASGSSATTISSLLGGSAIAGTSRGAARTMLSRAQAVRSWSLQAPFRTALDDLQALPANVARVFHSSNLAAAWAQLPGAAGRVFGTGGGTVAERLARFTANGDLVDHLTFVRGLHPAVVGGPEFVRATWLSAVGLGAQGTGSAVDGYQFVDLFSRSTDPVDRLHLTEPVRAR